MGSTCRVNIHPVEAPAAREASTKSRDTAESADARVMRAKVGIASTDTAAMALVRPGPITATSAMASSRADDRR